MGPKLKAEELTLEKEATSSFEKNKREIKIPFSKTHT